VTGVAQCELSGSLATGVSVQVVLEKEPVPPDGWLKVTVPVGLDFVPTLSLSSTTASQLEPWFSATGESQVTVVSVARVLTVMSNPSGSELGLCTFDPP
jgi:hypothetical protein